MGLKETLTMFVTQYGVKKGITVYNRFINSFTVFTSGVLATFMVLQVFSTLASGSLLTLILSVGMYFYTDPSTLWMLVGGISGLIFVMSGMILLRNYKKIEKIGQRTQVDESLFPVTDEIEKVLVKVIENISERYQGNNSTQNSQHLETKVDQLEGLVLNLTQLLQNQPEYQSTRSSSENPIDHLHS